MEETRKITSDFGLSRARKIKPEGRTLSHMEDSTMAKLQKLERLEPGKSFAELTPAQKNQVWLEIVESSGRDNAKDTELVGHLGKLGRGLAVFSGAVAAYNIYHAEDKVQQTVKEAGGFAGGYAGATYGASLGMVAGPIGVGVGIVVGGALGALGGDYLEFVPIDKSAIKTGILCSK